MARKDDYGRSSNEGVTDHGGLTGLEADGHLQYIHKEIARIITAQHTFNPLKVAPFIIGSDASGYVIVGLNADLLDGLEAAAFAAAIHTHVKADILDLEPIAVVPAADTIPLADGANKIALGWLLTGSGNGLDADMVDGKHAADLAIFNVAAALGTL